VNKNRLMPILIWRKDCTGKVNVAVPFDVVAIRCDITHWSLYFHHDDVSVVVVLQHLIGLPKYHCRPVEKYLMTLPFTG